MYCLRNVEKWVADHPELGEAGARILEQARDATEEKVIITAKRLKPILGAYFDQFGREVMASAEHVRLATEDIERT
ncbi:MAG: hypothetical protein HYV34_01720 [Candidatus Kerfeldbacteria bacterium]|nr:hypothetical protein [Candidatus Kerfeldbacteria bacterium]